MSHKVGPWIETDPAGVVSAFLERRGGTRPNVTPSPYDVPLAVRVVEGDPSDPAYDLEVRYLGGDELTESRKAANFCVDVGANSKRIYRLRVDSKAAKSGARTELKSLAEAVKQLRDAVQRRGGLANYELVSLVMSENESELVRTLESLSGQTEAIARRDQEKKPVKTDTVTRW